ncbi:unnamed protein product [Dicrocoelium dendriticum]|nr:unnamed protein product [Dicrocoelium dendriticum]
MSLAQRILHTPATFYEPITASAGLRHKNPLLDVQHDELDDCGFEHNIPQISYARRDHLEREHTPASRLNTLDLEHVVYMDLSRVDLQRMGVHTQDTSALSTLRTSLLPVSGKEDPNDHL